MLLEKHQIITFPQPLAELIDVLSREKSPETDEKQARSFLYITLMRASVVTVKRSFAAVPEHTRGDGPPRSHGSRRICATASTGSRSGGT